MSLNSIPRSPHLDLIRGVVILFIFVININYMSTPTVVRYNPLAFGDYSWLDQWVFLFEYSLIKQRFMPLLAFLYGAGIYLFAQNYQLKNPVATQRDLHFSFIKRSVLLILIGLAHAYLIWDGDVLVAYAICGLIVFYLRNLSQRWLYSLGCFLVILPILPDLYFLFFKFSQSIETPDYWLPDTSSIAQLTSAYQGSWWDTTPARIAVAWQRQSSDFLWFTLWRCSGLMLLGIAFMRSGFLDGTQSYRKGLAVSLLIGLPTSLISTYFYHLTGYSYAFFSTILTLCFYIGTLSLAYAYLCLLLIWGRSKKAPGTIKLLSRIGRMALTLYIMQSLIGTFIFYGWGLNLYAQVSRSELALITLATWIVQILFVILWSKYFKLGPLEWVWRRCYATRSG